MQDIIINITLLPIRIPFLSDPIDSDIPIWQCEKSQNPPGNPHCMHGCIDPCACALWSCGAAQPGSPSHWDLPSFLYYQFISRRGIPWNPGMEGMPGMDPIIHPSPHGAAGGAPLGLKNKKCWEIGNWKSNWKLGLKLLFWVE